MMAIIKRDQTILFLTLLFLLLNVLLCCCDENYFSNEHSNNLNLLFYEKPVTYETYEEQCPPYRLLNDDDHKSMSILKILQERSSTHDYWKGKTGDKCFTFKRSSFDLNGEHTYNIALANCSGHYSYFCSQEWIIHKLQEDNRLIQQQINNTNQVLEKLLSSQTKHNIAIQGMVNNLTDNKLMMNEIKYKLNSLVFDVNILNNKLNTLEQSDSLEMRINSNKRAEDKCDLSKLSMNISNLRHKFSQLKKDFNAFQEMVINNITLENLLSAKQKSSQHEKSSQDYNEVKRHKQRSLNRFIQPRSVNRAIRPFVPIFAESVLRSPFDGAIKGLLMFQHTFNGVIIYGIVCDLRPGKHGIHVHTYGALKQNDCRYAGGHFGNSIHGDINDASRHHGDLGNIEADSDGVAHVNKFSARMTIRGDSMNNILGRSIVVHDMEDTFIQSNYMDDGTACGPILLREGRYNSAFKCPIVY